MVDPRALRTFYAVCRAGSISQAARDLNISQPSVSVAIAQLEDRLGVTLFERGRTGIVLTPQGHAVRRRAEALDTLLRDVEEETILSRDAIAGPLRIGGTPGALVSLLPQAVKWLESRHGRFALNVLERPDSDLIGMLRKGEIELALVTTGIEQPPEDIEEIPLSRDPFAMIVGRANDGLPERMSLRDAQRMRWILPEAQGAFRRQIDALFMAAEVPAPRDVIRCDSLLATKAMVRDSERVTILPAQVAMAELSIGVLRAIAITQARFERSVGVRRMAHARHSILGSAFMQALGEQP
ncbi:MAG: LysR family transcriptional regulator [Sphingopyxis sp.]